MLLSMASTEFCEAVAYALRCVGLKDLTLKPKQRRLSSTCMTIMMSLFGSPRAMVSLCASNCSLKRTSSSSTRVERRAVLVVSPLVSLIIDPVSGLRKRGVSAAILSGNKGIRSR